MGNLGKKKTFVTFFSFHYKKRKIDTFLKKSFGKRLFLACFLLEECKNIGYTAIIHRFHHIYVKIFLAVF